MIHMAPYSEYNHSVIYLKCSSNDVGSYIGLDISCYSHVFARTESKRG